MLVSATNYTSVGPQGYRVINVTSRHFFSQYQNRRCHGSITLSKFTSTAILHRRYLLFAKLSTTALYHFYD